MLRLSIIPQPLPSYISLQEGIMVKLTKTPKCQLGTYIPSTIEVVTLCKLIELDLNI